MLDEKKSYMSTKPMNIKAYRKMKLKMLSRDFYITLTQKEFDHMNELNTEIAIDNFCITAINNHLN